MQPGYPGSGQDPYNQQPPSDPFGNPNYGQYPPQQPDPYAQPPASGAPYSQPPASGAPYAAPQQDPYAQPAEYSVQPPTSGQPYDPYNPGGQQQQPTYYQQPQSAPPGYPQAPAYQAPVVYPGQAGYTVPGAAPASGGSNPLAIVSLVLGIISIPVDCCLGAGLLFGGVALVLGFLGMNKAKAENLSGHGLALAGAITGGVGVLGAIVYWILYAVGTRM